MSTVKNKTAVPRATQAVSEEGPSTPRAWRTRDVLVRAAREVFEKHGRLDARVADIADAAGVAHGSFYTYFDSKEAIFREAANALVGDMFLASRVETEVPGDPITRSEATDRLYPQAYARMLAILKQVSTFNDYFRQLRLDIRKVFIDRAAATNLARLPTLGLRSRPTGWSIAER